MAYSLSTPLRAAADPRAAQVPVFGWIGLATGMVPLARTNRAKAIQTLAAAVRSSRATGAPPRPSGCSAPRDGSAQHARSAEPRAQRAAAAQGGRS